LIKEIYDSGDSIYDDTAMCTMFEYFEFKNNKHPTILSLGLLNHNKTEDWLHEPLFKTILQRFFPIHNPVQVIHEKDNDDEDSEREMREKGYTLPEYYFIIETLNGKHKSDKSGLLKFDDTIEIVLYDEAGNPAANEKYEVYNVQGKQVASGSLDSNGYAKAENIGTSRCHILFPESKKINLSI